MVRNFEHLEEGHWYIYTGTKRPIGWNFNGMMDFVLDHNPVKVIRCISGVTVTFDRSSMERTWNWAEGFDNWIEIEDPSLPLQKEDDVWVSVLQEIKREYIKDYAGKIASDVKCYALKRKPKKDAEKDYSIFYNLEVGTRVKLRDDLVRDRNYSDCAYVEGMAKPGSVVEVMWPSDLWRYSPEMFDCIISKPNENVKVKSKKITVKDIPLPCIITDIKQDKERVDNIFKAFKLTSEHRYVYNNANEMSIYNNRSSGYVDIIGWYKLQPKFNSYTFISYDDIIFESEEKFQIASYGNIKFPCVITGIERDKNRVEKIFSYFGLLKSDARIYEIFIREPSGGMWEYTEGPDFYEKNVPYSKATFYRYEDLFPDTLNPMFEEWPINTHFADTIYYIEPIYSYPPKGKRKSQINTIAPSVVGEYSPATREYRSKF